MISKIIRGIGGFIFWTYERGSWQYDVMVGLILAFIFFTPRQFFHDRPTLSEARQVVEVRGVEGTGYRIEAGVLQGKSRSLELNAEHVLEQVTGRPVEVRRIEPVLNSKGRVQAYTVWIQGKEPEKETK